jgi:hypothetical protein
MREPAFRVARGEHACSHTNYELRRRVIKNSTVQIGYQCTTCGEWDRLPKSEDPPMVVKPYDGDTLQYEYWRKYWAEKKATETAEQRRSYDEYMRSQAWSERREKRLTLDCYVCQAQILCDGSWATDVHHTTYAHFGSEPLWELRSVCRQCHDVLTDLDHGIDPDDEQAERPR